MKDIEGEKERTRRCKDVKEEMRGNKVRSRVGKKEDRRQAERRKGEEEKKK